MSQTCSEQNVRIEKWPKVSEIHPLIFTYWWPSPSHRPARLRPTPGKPHRQNLRTTTKTQPWLSLQSRTSKRAKAVVSRPRPDMNSNRMSLSSFFGFLSLRTRLMGTLALATAGSCGRKILHLMRHPSFLCTSCYRSHPACSFNILCDQNVLSIRTGGCGEVGGWTKVWQNFKSSGWERGEGLEGTRSRKQQ